MNAFNVAAQLKKLGYSSIAVVEPNDMVEGSVDINKRISIQMSQFGRALALNGNPTGGFWRKN